jgi:hypothetical protein
MSPTQESNRKIADLLWGEAVNGLRAAVELIPERDFYLLGETVGLRFHIKNVSGRAIQFTTTEWRQMDGVFLEDEDGREVLIFRGRFSGRPSLVRKKLQPGEKATLESAAMGIGPDSVEVPGVRVGYQLQCRHGRHSLGAKLLIPSVTSSSLPAEDGDWQGSVETGRRTLIVAAPPKKEELQAFVGLWRGLAADKPEDGSSRDSLAVELEFSASGQLEGEASGEFVLSAKSKLENLRIHGKEKRIHFEVPHRTGERMNVMLQLQDGQLRGEGIPTSPNGDRCDITLSP